MLNPDIVHDYMLGALSVAERAEVRRARLSDPELDAAILELEAQFAPLTADAGEAEVPPLLFDRIAAAIAAEQEEFAGKNAVEAWQGKWLRYRPGIEAKRLWNKHTIMLRCRPGAVLPGHDHGEDEHIVVISGDFVVGGRAFGPGDYQMSRAGSAHGDAFTRTGCVLLVHYGA